MMFRQPRERLIVEWDMERLEWLQVSPFPMEPRTFLLVGGPADGAMVEGRACPDAVLVDGEDGRYLPLWPSYTELQWWSGGIA